jgi:transcriptional regulator with XRE-family HTH domain
MRPKRDVSPFREQAIALRRAGKSRDEIKDIIGVRNNDALSDLLRGEPAPLSLRRPRAKDDLHAQACELRARGHTYVEIAARLGVSKGSVSRWVRAMPRVVSAPVENEAIVPLENEATQTDWLGDLSGGLGADPAAGRGRGAAAAGRTSARYRQVNGGAGGRVGGAAEV